MKTSENPIPSALRRSCAAGLVAGLLFVATGCTVPAARIGPPDPVGRFDPNLVPSLDGLPLPRIDLQIQAREVVTGVEGEPLLRVRFSFISYSGYIGAEDQHVSTGTVFFPVDGRGRARPAVLGQAVITEFPPGASRSGLAVQPEYGERPAVELGVPAAVVDLRGPIVRSLREFANPAGAGAETLRNEEQFAYTMLRSFQETANPGILYEQRVAEAWVRATRAVDEIVAQETGVRDNRFLLVGEGYGAVGAAQAAAHEPRVEGLVMCGWPVDWADLHFTRWRRWERRARYYPLRSLQPLAYETSRDVLSFLFSSYTKPDPGCPSCEGGGDWWRVQFDYLDLLRDGRLEGVRTLFLVGDSDPRFPIDLEARASARAEALGAPLARIEPGAAIPWGRGAAYGPFSADRLPLPFEDLRYLKGASSTLANPEAVESVLAWMQHLAGYRDVPWIRVFEAVEAGEVRVEVAVKEGNTAVTNVEVRLTEIESGRDSDFKWTQHLIEPEPLRWRRIDTIYSGHDERSVGRWRGYFPVDPTRNRAYYVVVRDRAGDVESAHSLPIRPMWNLGDPAVGPARF